MINELVYISASFYFEIKESELYGGVGSVGYAAINIGRIKNVNDITDETINKQILSVAEMCGISKDCVKLISKQEYDENTEEESEELDDYDY